MSRWSFCVALCLAPCACERGRADVLEEFPPPRLASEKSAAPQSERSIPADCKVTWRLFGRQARESYQFPGRGTFEVRGEPATPVSGVVAFDPGVSQPEMRSSVERALHSRAPAAPWLWRVLSLEAAGAGFDGFVGAAFTGVSGALSELELNGVRTKQNHRASIKLTTRDRDSTELVLDAQLRIDLAAHHVSGITLVDDAPPRRADLVVQCTLVTADDGE